jgi:glycosyltransferase involved in cell wall biosynthesis
MPAERASVFLINLVQDVNILRPLIFMAARDFAMNPLLLVSRRFCGRDLFGIWQRELREICADTGARLEFFDDDWEAHRQLTGQGVIFAASESHLHNHVTTHSVFRHAPPGYVRVTLQHGFECVGFRHSADHVRAHGPTASFGADYVCGWSGPDKLVSMAPSQLGKLLVTGPTAVLQAPAGRLQRAGDEPGMVCENLHSVRLNAAGDFKTEFVAAFSQFCRHLAQDKRKVVLRPHPGGQYVLKNKVPLPPNARLNNAPMYRVDLRRFAYGISAPSSVLIDMLLARIPTAVWRDRRGEMDADTYAGLTTVSTPSEWIDFARSATADPEPFLAVQESFLERQGLILDRTEVYSRYANIFQMVLRAEVRPVGAVAERERILFVANSRVPTLQLSFEKPLAPLVARGEFTTRLLTEGHLRRQPAMRGDSASQAEWIDDYLNHFGPSAIVFCRYSGPAHRAIVEWARREKVPVIYHIDDDLLAIPSDIGERKSAFHNAEERLATVRELITSADLVYASTERLRLKLLEYFPEARVVAGQIYCPGSVLRRPRPGAARKVGYMASADHAHNLEPILPALERMLERNPQVQLEFFGSIPLPPSLEPFADRISTAPPIANYNRFLAEFAEYEWDIGICPLSPIEFNLMKANTKWVEYTSVGAAVVASRGTVYDESCADGCGILADGPGEWLKALEMLLQNGEERVKMVERAQEKLEREYCVGRLREQVLNIIDQARVAATDVDRRTRVPE